MTDAPAASQGQRRLSRRAAALAARAALRVALLLRGCTTAGGLVVPCRGRARGRRECAAQGALLPCSHCDCLSTQGRIKAAFRYSLSTSTCPAPSTSGPILWRSSLKNTIYDVLKAREGWQESESEDTWDFFWADKGCALSDIVLAACVMSHEPACACMRAARAAARCMGPHEAHMNTWFQPPHTLTAGSTTSSTRCTCQTGSASTTSQTTTS